jgi:two-component system, NtrC family, sensor histidine kinase HydH
MDLGIRSAFAATGATAARGTDHTLAGRIAWITALRLAFLVLLLGATATLYLRGELARYPFSLRIVFITIGAGFALAGLYAAALRSGRHLYELAWTQIALDQLTWTAIVYVSGGAASGATSFYALTCLVGAVLVGLRGALGAAALGIGAYALLCAGFHFGWVLPPPDQAAAGYAVGARQLTYPLLLNTLGVSVIAVLSGYLAERLRLTGGALQLATARAYQAERLAVLGRIAAGLAHEIRNPLGSITGSIEMLRESPALSDEDRRLCDIVQREARRLNDLVGDMVDLSKPKAPRAEATDVAALAREVVALASNAARGSDVEVRYVGPSTEALARCDGAQMRQVLWNLVRNAMQASSAGSAVSVRVTPDERHVVLAVDDQGPGLPPDAGRIFDDFFTTRTHGAGIGLAVVRRILEDHAVMGARLSVEQAAGGGASFRVTLSRDVSGLRRSIRPPSMV